jgi:broad specificity phosphatase PhoE
MNVHINDGGHAIVVTHASVIRAAIVNVFQAPSSAFWRLDLEPLSFTSLDAARTRHGRSMTISQTKFGFGATQCLIPRVALSKLPRTARTHFTRPALDAKIAKMVSPWKTQRSSDNMPSIFH